MPVEIGQGGLLKPIFTSHTKVMLMTLLMMNPHRWFYQNELQALLTLPYTEILRQLKKLTAVGWLLQRRDGNRRYYKVGEDLFVYPEFKNIILKTTGVGDHIRWRMKAPSDVALAFVHGDFAGDVVDADSRLEVFVIGGLPERLLKEGFAYAARLHLRPVSWRRAAPEAFAAALRRKDADALRLLSTPKVFVVGNQRGLDALASAAAQMLR